MSDLGPRGEEPAWSSVLLFDEGVAPVDVGYVVDGAYSWTEADSAQAAAYYRDWIQTRTYAIGPVQKALLAPTLDQIAGAVEDGSVLPSEVRDAFQWSTGQQLGGYIPKDMILNGGLADKLTLWGLDHGRLPDVVSSQEVTTEAKASPKSRTVKATGVPHPVTKAITETAAALWSNVLSLTGSLTDQIVSEVRAVGYVATQGRAQAIATEKSLNSHVASTDVAIRALRAELKTAIRQLDALQGGPKPVTMSQVLTRVEEYLAHHSQPSSQKAITAIADQQKTDVQRLGGQQHEIVNLQKGVIELAPLLALKPLLQLQGTMQRLPTTLKTLEDCCYANRQVTKPISEGGATPSLLSQLGNLLKKAAEIFFTISIIDAIVGWFDMPLEVLTAVQSAEAIVPGALRAVAVVTQNVDLAGQVAGTA